MFKERKIEKYILLFLGVFAIILGILILDGRYLVISDDALLIGGVNSKAFCWVLIILGVFATVVSLLVIIKESKIKKYSVYYKLNDEYKFDNIKKDLSDLGLNIGDINIESFDNTINIEYKKGVGHFYCMVDPKEICLGYEYPDEYYEKYSEKELEKLPLVDLDERISPLNTILEDLYKKFIKIIIDNEDKLDFK